MIDFTRKCNCWLSVGRCRCEYDKNKKRAEIMAIIAGVGVAIIALLQTLNMYL